MRKVLEGIVYALIAPGEIFSNWLGITHEENRDLVRMLINGLFWIGVAVVGLAIWTSTFPEFQ
jgi:hypothetical protein